MASNSMKKQKSTDSSGSKKEPPTELLSFRPLNGGLGKRKDRMNQRTQINNQSQRRKKGVPDQMEAESQQVQPKSEFKDEPGETIKDAMKRKTGLEAPSVIEQRAKKRQEKQELKQKSKQDDKQGKSLLNLQIKDEQRTQQSAISEKTKQSENAQQRDQFEEVNGKLVKIKADLVYHPSSYQCVVMDSSKKRPTQNTYLRKSKRQKSSKWGGTNDEQKFYDALKVFGGDIGMIHSCVFCPKEAQPKYTDPDNFSERSMVQLKNKFRKEQDTINKMIDRKKKHEDMQWFEKKYGIEVMCKPSAVAQAPLQEDKLSDDNVTESSVQDDQSQAALSSMEQYASHMSAGLISDRGIAEYTKSLKSNSKYQTSFKSEK